MKCGAWPLPHLPTLSKHSTTPTPAPNHTHKHHSGNTNVSLIEKEEAGYIYRYQYNGVGEGVTWLSSKNYMVIDLAAGPTTYGPLVKQGGAATPQGIPSIKVCVFLLCGMLSCFWTATSL